MKDKEMIEIKRGAGAVADLLNQEMADLQKNEKLEQLIHELKIAMCSYENCEDCPTSWCYAEECATMAICKGYRKVDKDSIVINKEELKKELQYLEKQARKETAEKFYKKVKKLLKKVDIIVDGDEGLVGYEESAVDKGLTELAKQFGVEVEK